MKNDVHESLLVLLFFGVDAERGGDFSDRIGQSARKGKRKKIKYRKRKRKSSRLGLSFVLASTFVRRIGGRGLMVGRKQSKATYITYCGEIFGADGNLYLSIVFLPARSYTLARFSRKSGKS